MCGALTTRSPLGGEQGATEIEPLFDIHAGGRVAQRDAHLLGDAGELVVEDLQHHRVGCGRRPPLGAASRLLSVSSSSPRAKHFASQPGSRPRSDVASQTMAGPRARRPDAISRVRRPASAAAVASNQRLGRFARHGSRRASADALPRRLGLIRPIDFHPHRDNLQGPLLVDDSRTASRVRPRRPRPNRRRRFGDGQRGVEPTISQIERPPVRRLVRRRMPSARTSWRASAVSSAKSVPARQDGRVDRADRRRPTR